MVHTQEMAIDATITTIPTAPPSPTTKILRSQTTRFFPALLHWCGLTKK